MHCVGCWAGEYGHKNNLSFEDMDKIITEGKELGAVSYTHLYDVDFKTSLAKLEKDSTGRITGIIAQSTEDDHFILSLIHI